MRGPTDSRPLSRARLLARYEALPVTVADAAWLPRSSRTDALRRSAIALRPPDRRPRARVHEGVPVESKFPAALPSVVPHQFHWYRRIRGAPRQRSHAAPCNVHGVRRERILAQRAR